MQQIERAVGLSVDVGKDVVGRELQASDFCSSCADAAAVVQAAVRVQVVAVAAVGGSAAAWIVQLIVVVGVAFLVAVADVAGSVEYEAIVVGNTEDGIGINTRVQAVTVALSL